MAGIGGKGSVYGTFTNQIELQSHGWGGRQAFLACGARRAGVRLGLASRRDQLTRGWIEEGDSSAWSLPSVAQQTKCRAGAGPGYDTLLIWGCAWPTVLGPVPGQSRVEPHLPFTPLSGGEEAVVTNSVP